MNNMRALILSFLILSLWTIPASGQQGNTIRNRLRSRWSGVCQATTKPPYLSSGCIATKNTQSDALWSNYCRCSESDCDGSEVAAIVQAPPVPTGVDFNFFFSDSKADPSSTDCFAPGKDAFAPRIAQRLRRSLHLALGERRRL